MSPAFATCLGLRIFSNPLAREVRIEHRVEKHPTQKRRRRWRVVAHRVDRPCAYKVGNTIHMHPELYANLQALTP